MAKNNRRIIIIDDDFEIWNAYRFVLAPQKEALDSSLSKITRLLDTNHSQNTDTGFEFQLTYESQGQDGFNCVKEAVEKGEPFAVAFIDIRMPPGWDGMETAKRIRQIDRQVEIVIVTAFSDRTREDIVKSVGPPDKLLFLRKPFDPEELTQIALSLSEKWNLARQEEKIRIALKESEARFKSLVETTPDWVWETDRNGYFTYCSPVCRLIYGYQPEELIGKTIFEPLLSVDDSQNFKQIFFKCTRGEYSSHGIERRCFRKDGKVVDIETRWLPVMGSNGKTIGFRGIDRDITLRKKMEKDRQGLEKQFRQAQKLEAVGTLAGGIAHDFNNILSGIMGFTQLISLEITGNVRVAEYLEKITSASIRAADLINQILTFSRQTDKEKTRVNLKPIIKEVLKLLRAPLPSTIEIHHNINTEFDVILADPTQIHQVLMNLGTNAAHAMENTSGLLEINLSDASIETANETLYPELEKGPYLKLVVRDTGYGMDQQTMEKIFEPFLTTKEFGKGTGLGLSVVHGIIKSHSGAIRVYSALGKGTEFQIFLPRIQSTIKFEDDAPVEKKRTGNERILFVDDEETLVEIFKSLMENLGYKVTGLSNSKQALEVFSVDPDNFDLVVTDLTMPEMTGDILAKNIFAIRPDIPVILCSGLGATISKEKALAMGIREFVRKPVSRKKMAEIIRKIMDK